jgi:hypothetical protein
MRYCLKKQKQKDNYMKVLNRDNRRSIADKLYNYERKENCIIYFYTYNYW